MTRPRKVTTSSADRGRALGEFLAARLAIDVAAATLLVRGGSVYVDRRRVEDPTVPVQPGWKITAYTATADLTDTAEAVRSSDLPWRIAYEDADVIVADKPPGMPVQATRFTTRATLDRLVQEREPDARLLHRIDRGASGLVLFTRTPDARRRFTELLIAGALERVYRAAVWGHVQSDAGDLTWPIGPDPRDRRRMMAGAGRPAITRFVRVCLGETDRRASITILELKLGTGRTHQIRVHLSRAGHAICGDALYGDAAPHEVERLFLHAHRLAWPAVEAIVSPVPPSFDELLRCSR